MFTALLLASLAASPLPPEVRISLTPNQRNELELREQYLDQSLPSMAGPGTALGLSVGALVGAVASGIAGLIVNTDWSILYSDGFDARRHLEPWIVGGLFSAIAAVAIPIAIARIRAVAQEREMNRRERDEVDARLRAGTW